LNITNNQQLAENLEIYFEMVREINLLSDRKIMMKEKSIVNIIEKNIYPILQELLTNVKKAVKYRKILDTMKSFTSLPNIIYNRINRKYGVKALAIKNIKALLMALKISSKIT
jgi:TPP-dependent trihydroxycyclohexane-1,2-dione (THcHDO) dehydratase